MRVQIQRAMLGAAVSDIRVHLHCLLPIWPANAFEVPPPPKAVVWAKHTGRFWGRWEFMGRHHARQSEIPRRRSTRGYAFVMYCTSDVLIRCHSS